MYFDDVRVGNYFDDGVVEQSALVATASPNPTSGRVLLEINAVDGQVVIFDVLGKQMLTALVSEGRAEIDLSTFAKGVYVARISSETGTSTIKFVKE